MPQILKELRRRGLLALLALYVVGAWVVLQAAALAFPGLDVPDSAIRYVWIGAVVLFPCVLIFGWMYEITAAGVRRHTAGAEMRLRVPDYFVISALAFVGLCTVFLVIGEVLDARTAPADAVAEVPENSIAVLPFVNMTADVENEYFSDGISEQLLNELARVPGLHVAARTSAFYYKGRNEAVPKMGRELGVRSVLEGSVRRSGDTVRITAQLIDAESGYHLWSETYERQLDDILAVQDEISRAIVETLKVRMLAEDRLAGDDIGPRGAEAYDSFLRGLSIQRGDGQGRYDKAIAFYRRTVELAPSFTAAHRQIAYCYLMQPYSDEMSFADAIDAAEPYLQRALELEPGSAEVIATLALSRSMSRDYAESNRLFQEAIRINPGHFDAQMHYGLSLVYQGRLKEASTAYLHAQALDPMNATLNSNLGALLMLMGSFDDGLGFAQKALEIDPGRLDTRSIVVYWMSEYGRLAEAVLEGRAILEHVPDDTGVRTTLVRAYTRLGMPDVAAGLLEEVWQMSPDITRAGWTSDYFYMATNDAAGFLEFAEDLYRRVDAKPGDALNHSEQLSVYWYGRALLMQGRDAEAAELLAWALGGQDGMDRITYDYVFFPKFLAEAYLRLGRDDDARELLERSRGLVIAARDGGWSTPVLFVRLAEIEVLLGDSTSALQNLNTAVDKGFRDVAWLRYSMFFRTIQSDPEMQRLQSVIRADVESQRASLETRMQEQLREAATGT